ncbi:immunoglobulin lambda-1 light chain-like isoform X2 [Vombatus ursinus]|uniref:immunoglobulin lambda-1 light chain-like isoform X2 n=1 Tax=Vombatus ursinus TaxID=29139 RepID=UPI000FFD72B3|nr:immunoglobulin lambda-1 light chain-like isoform X2 [Vombatus ursinus]
MKWVWPFASLTFFYAVVSDIQLEQPNQTLSIRVGMAITLQCTLKGGDLNSHQMTWYKKNWDNSLTFIYQHKDRYGPGFQGNFLGNIVSNKFFTLEIVKAAVKDTGTYYCGSVIGGSSWHTRAMHFGSGTKLSVEPELQEPSTPSVFVMKNGTNVACLVKDFYPKPVDIHLDPDNNATEEVVTTANGKFSAVKLGQYKKDLEQIKCTVQHNNKTVEASYKRSHEESTDESPDLEEPIGQECPKSTVQIEKVNLLSITLLGLRVLLAKSIAVNFFLTIKCFLP